MMPLRLTAERLREVLDYDPMSGIFRWKFRPELLPRLNKQFAGKVAGTMLSLGYIQIFVDGEKHLAHRLAVLYMTGSWPTHEVDHRDTRRWNNVWDNLREATRAENARNSGPTPRNSAGFRGVSFDKVARRYKATICIVTGKPAKTIGYFATAEEASRARDEWATLHHGEFARTHRP